MLALSATPTMTPSPTWRSECETSGALAEDGRVDWDATSTVDDSEIPVDTVDTSEVGFADGGHEDGMSLPEVVNPEDDVDIKK